MDKKLIGKYAMMALGMALTAASSFVSSKNQEVTMKETITEEVKKALASQTKES